MNRVAYRCRETAQAEACGSDPIFGVPWPSEAPPCFFVRENAANSGNQPAETYEVPK